MRARPTLVTAVLAAALALGSPAAAGAKGIVAADVCGGATCHAVAPAAVRAGYERFTPAPAPDRAEPFLALRVRARVSSGRVAVVGMSVWLPRANLVRAAGERAWTRPAPVLSRALRRAARGLQTHPAAGLGGVSDAPPRARVVEVVAPAQSARAADAGPVPALLAAAALAVAAAAAALARRARRGRRIGPAERPPAMLRSARS